MLNRLAEIFLFKELGIEAVLRFKQSVQDLAEAAGGSERIMQALHQLGQLKRGCDPDLVPVKIVFKQLGQDLIGRLVGRVLQAAGVNEVLQHLAVGWGSDRFVMLFENLVELVEFLGAIGE